MDVIIQFLLSNPTVFIIILAIFCLGGLVNFILLVDRRWGLFGEKQPTNDDVMVAINLIGNNHLHGVDEKLDRIIEQNVGMDKRLVRVETLLDIGVK